MINILYQSDNNYAPYMGVSILSLFMNNTELEDVVIYIINDNISHDNLEKLKNLAKEYKREIIFLDIEKVLNDDRITRIFCYSGFRANKHSYLKMFVSELLPHINGKLLYVDCDTIIEGRIDDIFEFDMNENLLGMVQDSLIGNEKTSIGMDVCDRYYNSGVILFNLEKWRECRGFERFINHVETHKYGTVDQDALNMAFRTEIATLPLKFNVQSVHLVTDVNLFSKVCKHKEPFYSYEDIESATANPVIIHFLRFMGEHPWDAESLHPGKKVYDKYCLISAWKNTERKRPKLGIEFKIEKIMYKYMPRGLFFRIYYFVHEKMIKKSNA